MQLESSTDVTEEIYRAAWTLLMRMWDGKKPLRLLNVTATRLTEFEYRQYSLFDSVDYEKLEKSESGDRPDPCEVRRKCRDARKFLKSSVSPTSGGLNKEKRRESIEREADEEAHWTHVSFLFHKKLQAHPM